MSVEKRKIMKNYEKSWNIIDRFRSISLYWIYTQKENFQYLALDLPFSYKWKSRRQFSVKLNGYLKKFIASIEFWELWSYWIQVDDRDHMIWVISLYVWIALNVLGLTIKITENKSSSRWLTAYLANVFLTKLQIQILPGNSRDRIKANGAFQSQFNKAFHR